MIITNNEKYILRTWDKRDAESLAEQLNNKRIWDNSRDTLPFPYALENARTVIDAISKKDGIHDFCIEVNGRAVGNIGFMPQSDIQRFNAEVGYLIGEDYWNRGIVSSALEEAIAFYFANTPIIRVFAFVFECNMASMRVLEKCEFTKVGIMRKSIFKNGEFCDAHYFERLK